ncbi:PucR family transcriptional regulator [Arthrobacter sp. AL12]|uniref:PucR family transcriptional regulator n=1 Tax=Arthrobacter sp. AL12 TaxID=3042241 RepID=UPI00249BAE44|nr:PucR family transcriptional regulator [Arthrobacter sp. AL12]MDI3212340.1 PucR family transcriptional regulator ligand-binding domain-containing protein [Arthrobacter sp. AL12]
MRLNAPKHSALDVHGNAADGAERLGFVTLAQFLRQLPPELSVLHDGGHGAERLRWVEPSELEDPTPYLLDGEFLLTAGLPFLGAGGAGDLVDAYVQRLVGARVSALGFGLEPYFDAVPDAVVQACRRHNLTLVAVPKTVPFAAVGLAFSQLLESDNATTFRQLADTNRQLMRAVLSARPEHELLAALVQRVPVWAVLVGADGRVRARGTAGAPGATTTPGVDAATLQPLLARLLSGSGPRVELDSFGTAGSALVFGYPLRSTRDANLGALVLGTDAPLTPAQNSVVSTAVGLLELLVRQRTSGSLAPSQLATALLLHPDSLVSGGTRHLNGLKDLLAQSVSSTRSGQLRVVLGIRPEAAGTPDAPAAPAGSTAPAAPAGSAASAVPAGTTAAPARAGRSVASPVRELLEWRRMFDTKLVEITDSGFAAITRLKVDDALLAVVERQGWRLVIGSATELSGLAEAYERAWSLRGRVGTTGRSLRVDDVTWSVAGLLGKEAGAMLATRLLAPVLALAPERRDALLGILRAWLGENGSWDATAKATGLHRNSVRRQIGLLAELLELDLNQAQARAELWIALQYTDELPGMSAAPAAPESSAGQLPQER